MMRMLYRFLVLACFSSASAQSCKAGNDDYSTGDVLPFPPGPMGGSIGPTVQDSVHKWRTKPERLPKDAPNIVIFMFDDAGFGQAKAYGGKIDTPTISKLKSEGISYNAFHTTAMCSPTRASLLTGRNHHRVGAGQIAEFANDWDGYTGIIPKTSATLAEVLRYYGYGTAAFGKDHNTPVNSLGTGPYERTPTGRGFDYFYGFIAGESSQWEPLLWENNAQVKTPSVKNYEDYHLTEDIARKAIDWMRRSRALHPERPFLLWWTPGAVHGPHHVARKWADKYKGKFSGGWDAYVDETLERQKEMGWVPKDTKRPPRPAGMPSWDSLSDKEKAFQERLMEVYAGFLEHTDAQMGKVVDEIESLGIRNNTIIINIFSDNGASAEGMGGSVAELNAQNGIPTTVEDHLAVLEDFGGLSAIGGLHTDNMYHSAWAWAGDCPFKFTKLVASDFGGTRTPMTLSWPKRISPDAKPRTQFHHVVDIVPTIYEILNISPPKVVDGHAQDPIDGTSMVYTFGNAEAEERVETQYFDIFADRGVYHKGWMASAFGPRTPWGGGKDLTTWSPIHDTWGLYDTKSDYNLLSDLSESNPEKLEELKAVFMKTSTDNKALPIGGGLWVVAHPQDMIRTTNTKWTMFGGMYRIPESECPNVRNGNVKGVITATVPQKVDGVLFALGGYAGGVSLYALEGNLYYEYSALLLRRFKFKLGALTAGNLTIDMKMVTPQRAGPSTVSFSINAVAVKDIVVERTVPLVFTAAEGFDVGADLGSPVANDYFKKAPFEFTGKDLRVAFEDL